MKEKEVEEFANQLVEKFDIRPSDIELSAKNLYEAITNEQSKTNVIDWYKDEQPRQAVKFEVESILDETLPDSYDKEIFNVKTEIIMTHLMEEAMMEQFAQ